MTVALQLQFTNNLPQTAGFCLDQVHRMTLQIVTALAIEPFCWENCTVLRVLPDRLNNRMKSEDYGSDKTTKSITIRFPPLNNVRVLAEVEIS